MTVTAAALAALKEAYRIWHETKGGRVDQWIALMGERFKYGSLDGGAPGVEFTKGGTTRADCEAYLLGLIGDWELIYYRTEQFIAQGDRVVVFSHSSWRNRRTGKTVEGPVAHIWRYENGKAVELFEFCDTAKWAAAARRDCAATTDDLAWATRPSNHRSRTPDRSAPRPLHARAVERLDAAD